MNAVFSYNPENQKFGMEFNGEVFYFTYDFEKYSVKTVWNEDGKVIARSYKGLRSKLGIHKGSPEAQELVNTIKQVQKFKG